MRAEGCLLAGRGPLAEWCLSEKSRIDALPLDGESKQEHAAGLDMRYAERTHELLQRIEP